MAWFSVLAVALVGLESSQGAGEVMQVEVVKVTPAARAVTEEVVGSVRPKQRSVVEAKVSGRLAEMPAGLGVQVKGGDVLVVVDAQEVRARMEQASAQREQAGKDLERARTLAARQAVWRPRSKAPKRRPKP
jgi:multidrug efflux pump subunit AcrA (membrane-fusion protein)